MTLTWFDYQIGYKIEYGYDFVIRFDRAQFSN
jgi:hypothetical protein